MPCGGSVTGTSFTRWNAGRTRVCGDVGVGMGGLSETRCRSRVRVTGEPRRGSGSVQAKRNECGVRSQGSARLVVGTGETGMPCASGSASGATPGLTGSGRISREHDRGSARWPAATGAVGGHWRGLRRRDRGGRWAGHWPDRLCTYCNVCPSSSSAFLRPSLAGSSDSAPASSLCRAAASSRAGPDFEAPRAGHRYALTRRSSYGTHTGRWTRRRAVLACKPTRVGHLTARTQSRS